MTDRNQKCGCVLFDPNSTNRCGWASVSGDAPFRINGTKQLSASGDDIIWLNNFDFKESFSAGLENHAGFRRNDFLSEPIISNSPPDLYDYSRPDIAAMLGVNSAILTDRDILSQRLSSFFEKVMRVSDYFGLSEVPPKSIHHGINELAMPVDQFFDEEILSAIESATVNYVNSERPSDIDSSFKKITLLAPKAAHGISCSNVMMPQGEWERLSLPKKHTSDAIDQWLIENGVYVLAQCSIQCADDSAHALLNFGSGRGAKKWITGIEIALINRFANISIKKAFGPKKVMPIDFVQEMIKKHDPLYELSLSNGFFWQNVWLAISSKKKPALQLKNNKKPTNPVSPFVRALDRNNCFLIAMALRSFGIIVTGYGKGKIHILHGNDKSHLANACRMAGAIPPFLDGEFRDDGDDSPLSMFQEIYIQGDYNQLESTDSQILELMTC